MSTFLTLPWKEIMARTLSSPPTCTMGEEDLSWGFPEGFHWWTPRSWTARDFHLWRPPLRSGHLLSLGQKNPLCQDHLSQIGPVWSRSHWWRFLLWSSHALARLKYHLSTFSSLDVQQEWPYVPIHNSFRSGCVYIKVSEGKSHCIFICVFLLSCHVMSRTPCLVKFAAIQYFVTSFRLAFFCLQELSMSDPSLDLSTTI